MNSKEVPFDPKHPRCYTKVVLDPDEKEVIYASILGDGSVTKPSTGNLCFYHEAHADEQLPYLEWKSHYFEKFEPYFYKSLKSLQTPRHVFWNNLRKLFYQEGKNKRATKVLTKEILDCLGPLGLMVWHIDDGSYNYSNRTVQWSTDCFTKKQVVLVKRWLFEKFGIATTTPKHQNRHVVHFSRNQARKLLALFEQYYDSLPKCPFIIRKFGKDETRLQEGIKKHRGYGKLYMRKRRLRLRLTNPEKYWKAQLKANKGRRLKYQTDEEYRKKIVQREAARRAKKAKI